MVLRLPLPSTAAKRPISAAVCVQKANTQPKRRYRYRIENISGRKYIEKLRKEAKVVLLERYYLKQGPYIFSRHYTVTTRPYIEHSASNKQTVLTALPTYKVFFIRTLVI